MTNKISMRLQNITLLGPMNIISLCNVFLLIPTFSMIPYGIFEQSHPFTQSLPCSLPISSIYSEKNLIAWGLLSSTPAHRKSTSLANVHSCKALLPLSSDLMRAFYSCQWPNIFFFVPTGNTNSSRPDDKVGPSKLSQ